MATRTEAIPPLSPHQELVMNDRVNLSGADIFNAIPIPAFLVDHDVRIRDSNTAALATFGLSKQMILSRRGGEVLNCLHSRDVPEGCGRGPACKNCVIRDSVTSSLQGAAATRRRMRFELRTESQKTELELLVSASPIAVSPEETVLLMVEDITQISKLRSIVPICSQCKRIRNDAEYWQQVEAYFHEFIGVDFSHGLCPECWEQVYGDYVKEKPVEAPGS
jgi:hypothetical protein